MVRQSFELSDASALGGTLSIAVGVGALLGPPLISTLIDPFGYNGALLFAAAIASGSCMLALLFKPAAQPARPRPAVEPAHGSDTQPIF